MQKNFKTPIEKILFRSSSIGLLAGGLLRNDLTDKQRTEIEELKDKAATPIGLTKAETKELNKLEATEKASPEQLKKINDFVLKRKTPKFLTEKQNLRLSELTAKENAEPELSKGAKTYIKSVWLEHEKNFHEDIHSKYTKKGLQGEEDGINLTSFVDGIMYIKNEKRITKGNLTGECDINTYFKDAEARVIDDIKLSWNPKTFMSSDLSTLYEWQGRAYLYLYDADIFRLRYCLVDCPPDVYIDEFKKFCWQNNIIDETLPEYQAIIKQFENNFLYENSGNYTQKERVKTFSITRDKELEKILLKSIDLAIEYYESITLNMIE